MGDHAAVGEQCSSRPFRHLTGPPQYAKKNTAQRVFTALCVVCSYLFSARSMLSAASFPAPIAWITVAAPVTASPPAQTASWEVSPASSTRMQPLSLTDKPGVVSLIKGLGVVPRDMITQSVGTSSSLPGTTTGRRRPELSGSPNSIWIKVIEDT